MNSIDFAGNERVIEQLGYLIDAKRFPHALIIEGAQGLGKKTLARQMAKALVCRGENRPCNSCVQCRKAEEKIHPDIFEHSAEGGVNSFHVDVVRKIIRDAYVTPNESDYKIYILGNADCMSISAQNALLKVLEEPPEYVIFILTAKSKGSLLQTVISRSVVVTLEGVKSDVGARYIAGHYEDCSFEQAKSTVESFNGNIGKALDSIKNGKESEVFDIACQMSRTLIEDNEYELLKLCSKLMYDRKSIVLCCDILKNIFRDALIFGSNAELLSGQDELVKQIKNKINQKKLVDLISVCDTLKDMTNINCGYDMLLTKFCYSLRQAIGR